ncbi:MAG: hypothetical protein ABF242_07475 [Flavobacteriales bacterium]
MTKTYSQPKFMKALTVIGLSFFNFILIYFFISIANWEYDFYAKAFYLFSCFSFWIMVNYGLLDLLLEKVTITKEAIDLRSLFKRKSIQTTEIKGFQLKNKNIFLIPENENSKGISFSDNLVSGEEKILDYFKTKD